MNHTGSEEEVERMGMEIYEKALRTQVGTRERRRKVVQGIIGLAMLLFGLYGCHGKEADAGASARFALPAAPPNLGKARRLEAGVLKYEVSLPHDGISTRLFIFMPDTPAATKRPCILIAPAGSRMFHGMALSEGDLPESLPYVHAGYIVVAYDLDGDIREDAKDTEIYAAIKAFMQADSGLADARLALDYALAKVPGIDPKRIYTAGHSSAATVSLYVAEHEPRIKACIAYAPICYLEERLPSALITVLNNKVPGFRPFIHRVSPSTDMVKLTCPVFLFHADDDSNVPTEEVTRFAAELKKTNKQVKFAHVPTGEHYDSMISQGIPQAIEWLKHLPAPVP